MSTHESEVRGSPLNYFTCTLGQAAEQSLCGLTALGNINDFIDHQAEKFPDRHAVGFPIPSSSGEEWKYRLLTYKELQKNTIVRASALEQELEIHHSAEDSYEKCVALLWPSSLGFLINWLALMRCGFSVLLIAPQCTPEAVAGLCEACDVKKLVYHKSYADLASKTAYISSLSLSVVQSSCLISREKGVYSAEHLSHDLSFLTLSDQATQQSTAFIFHTSGTSTGIPSPIRQSHRAAFAVLPVLEDSDAATFTTTPLYHGGIADCFRAWSSSALIWLYPGADTAITTQNIQKCLKATEEAMREEKAASVKYFSCVPFVLQMLSEEESGLESLKKMEIVGVGGAALSKTLGDRLVENGVPLVSRFGSAECGFQMSSYRDFAVDKDWDYLRYDLRSDWLAFELCGDGSGLSELIVKPSWPHLAKTNQEDGGFATSDLFEPHPTIKNAWRHHSRKDGQITLSTGKKFDPAPIEAEIAACSPLIREAMMVGNGRHSAGVLVFLSISQEEARNLNYEELWTKIEAIISKYPSHVRCFQSNCSFGLNQPPLPRSSKGTLMRGVAEKILADGIDRVYGIGPLDDIIPRDGPLTLTLENAKEMVRRNVFDVLKPGQRLDDEDDFYTNGVDSIMCTRIRAGLEQRLVIFSRDAETKLPWNVVYDCGNIRRLSDFIAESCSEEQRRSRGSNTGYGIRKERSGDDAVIAETMEELAERSSKIDLDCYDHSWEAPASSGSVVLLTGATGALGAHILFQLLSNASVRQIVCLVRAVNEEAARKRVFKSLADRGMEPLNFTSRLVCFPSAIGTPEFGRDFDDSGLLENLTHIIHAAWDVNFSLPIRSFQPHFDGLFVLLQLAYTSGRPVKFSFCSSVASVSAQITEDGTAIKEELSSTTSDASPTGYGRSKWVAEAICAKAVERAYTKKHVPPRFKMNILRLGQLTGDTKMGIWNPSEAWPLMLSTVDLLNSLPKIEQPLDWLPLDTAAKAVLETMFADSANEDACKVYHIVQYKREKTWMDLLNWIWSVRDQEFMLVRPEYWLMKLEMFGRDHPASALLGLWKNAYGEGAKNGASPDFAVTEVVKVSQTMRNLEPLSEEQGKKILQWIYGK